MNLLSYPAIKTKDDNSNSEHRLTLPGVFAALLRDAATRGGEIESFPALRPHQRHAWHSCLALIGALALRTAGRSDLPTDEAYWTTLLRGLTPAHPGDEPWSLVAPPDKPAFLQPPLPDGKLADLKNTVATPDALDMLVTAKNHDLKREVMADAAPDDWLFALVTLQTMEGFLGAGNYGISRMNGGFANRVAVSIAPPGGPGAHLARDIHRLLALHPEKPEAGRLALVWLEPWDGAASIRPDKLDPYYVEICRRVRLFESNGKLAARSGGSKAPRIVAIPGGLTDDPWAPVVTDSGGTSKVFTLDAGGFGYRRMVQIMFGREAIEPSPLQKIAPDDAQQGLVMLARALVRGQGKTEGYHERRVAISNSIAGFLGRKEATDALADAAGARVEIASEVQNRVLKTALLALFENGPEQIDLRDDGASRRADAFLKRFDAEVDRDFFPRLWEEFEDGADRDAVRRAWIDDLLRAARRLVDEADRGSSKAVKRRYRARARAEAVLNGARKRNAKLSPYFPEAA